MFPPQTPVKPRMTPAVLVASAIVKAIMSSIQPVVYAIVPVRAIVPVSLRPPAVPAAVARIMAINKLGALAIALFIALAVVLIIVATSATSALIGESGPR